MEEEDCMACKEWEEHRYWKHVDVKGKLFFRVMVDDFSQSLKIPKKFANLMREELSEIVNLKDPSGIIWHVELKKTADGASFQSGWRDFAEAHHLEQNDLLLFEYDGNSCFKVKILEGSGCEKAHSHCLKIKNSLKRGMSEDSEEVLDVTLHRKVNVSHSSSSSHDDILYGQRISSPRKISGNQRKPNKNQRIVSKCRKKISTSNELPVHEKNTRGNTGKRVDTSKDARYHIKQKSDCSHEYENLTDKEDICISRRSLTDEEEKRASQLVHEVRSGKPYFISVMRPTNIAGTFLTVPAGFKAYPPLQNCEIILQVAGMKKKWRVRYITNEITSRFTSRWKHFVHDNGLLEGDMCLFELINNYRDNIVVRVKISRVP